MEYQLSKAMLKSETIDLILQTLRIKREEMNVLLKKRNITTPKWRDYMAVINTLNGSLGTCDLCGSPLMQKKPGLKVCSLYPVHSLIRSEKELGKKCEHDLYLIECEPCMAQAKEANITRNHTMKQWFEEHADMVLKWV